MEVQISLSAQHDYEMAVDKYGEEFAKAVVAREVQLHADGLTRSLFNTYAGYEEFREFIKSAD